MREERCGVEPTPVAIGQQDSEHSIRIIQADATDGSAQSRYAAGARVERTDAHGGGYERWIFVE